MTGVYQHLVSLGMYRDMLASVIGVLAASAVSWLPFRRHRQGQQKIADKLDTSTPGGLSDVVRALAEKEQHRG